MQLKKNYFSDVEKSIEPVPKIIKMYTTKMKPKLNFILHLEIQMYNL